jgi:hypothetical protein
MGIVRGGGIPNRYFVSSFSAFYIKHDPSYIKTNEFSKYWPCTLRENGEG